MQVATRKAFRVGIFSIACTAVVLSSVGCESSTGMAVNPTNPMCPICGTETQVRPAAGIEQAKVVCPICGQATNVSERFLDRLEIFTGGPVGDTVYACAMCGTIVEQCAACRQKGCVVANPNTRGWQ